MNLLKQIPGIRQLFSMIHLFQSLFKKCSIPPSPPQILFYIILHASNLPLAFSYAAWPFNNHIKIFLRRWSFYRCTPVYLDDFFFFSYLRQVAGINRLGINPCQWQLADPEPSRIPTLSIHRRFTVRVFTWSEPIVFRLAGDTFRAIYTWKIIIFFFYLKSKNWLLCCCFFLKGEFEGAKKFFSIINNTHFHSIWNKSDITCKS